MSKASLIKRMRMTRSEVFGLTVIAVLVAIILVIMLVQRDSVQNTHATYLMNQADKTLVEKDKYTVSNSNRRSRHKSNKSDSTKTRRKHKKSTKVKKQNNSPKPRSRDYTSD